MRLPADDNRHAILGMTGSGKTRAGIWALSHRSYDRMPWIVLDYKCEPFIARIPGLEEIDVTKKPPRKAGLYVARPLPHQENEVTDFLWKIWQNERTGLYVDEGYMIKPLNPAYRALLTQGRSKRIPIITLSQQPVWISPFVLSESEFIQSFFLHKPADRKRVGEFMPGADPVTLERFHSYWFDVARRELVTLKPVQDESLILERFELRRPRKRWFL